MTSGRRLRRWTTVLLGGLTACTIAARVMTAANQNNESAGWTIPAGAGAAKNPVLATPDVLSSGAGLYKDKCRRCHGATGTGNGPDADRDHPPGDLTDAARASRNPDGVMFYKIWNGRAKPKMPAFKTDLSRTDVWTVVLYAKTLRR